jgi:PD-(D/E)XK endonuclease
MRNNFESAPLPSYVAKLEAVGLTTRKSRGEAAEAAFLAKAAGLGFGVSKPWGDSERYDFIIDSGYNFWRVQVKSTQRFHNWRYQVKTSGWKAAYTNREIDFLIAYIAPEHLWYVVPIAAVVPHQHLRFYPQGGRKSQLEKYRDAWCQMACPRDEDGPSRVPVTRRCQHVRRRACPLSEKGTRRPKLPRPPHTTRRHRPSSQ